MSKNKSNKQIRTQIEVYVKNLAEQSSIKIGYHVDNSGRKFQLYSMDKEGKEYHTLGPMFIGASNFFDALKTLNDFSAYTIQWLHGEGKPNE